MKADHRVWVLVLAVTTWVSGARADPVALPRTGQVVTYGAGGGSGAASKIKQLKRDWLVPVYCPP